MGRAGKAEGTALGPAVVGIPPKPQRGALGVDSQSFSILIDSGQPARPVGASA
jgi:hypothetical protein